jgi:hypothetical protein
MAYPTGGANAAALAQYSGKFIPQMWSSKLNAKFYKATVFGEIDNTNWEGEIKNQGDKVVINNVPTISIRNHTVGVPLTYDVPTPSTVDLNVDKGKYFGFEVEDVLEYQSTPKLMDVFSDDASQQMKIAIDSTTIFNTFSGAAAANKGATAGVGSASYNLGTDAAPIVLTAANVLSVFTSMSSVLDEQNVPETERWLLIDPATRNLLMSSNLAQAQFTGDATSILRNGKIGVIDRFTVYVSNNLPRAAAAFNYASGDGSEGGTAAGGTAKRRAIIAGHKSGIAWAAQMSKVEQIRNPNAFGDYVRGLNIYGYQVVKPEALTFAAVQ